MNARLLRRRRFLTYLGLGSLGIGSTACAAQFGSATTSTPIASKTTVETTPNADITKSNNSEVTTVDEKSKASSQKLPEFQGISQWLNSSPLTVQELKGNVVLIQFWTFSCINCQRTLPYVTKWHDRYAAKGLKIIGVHTPEFAFERDPNNIKDAMQKHGILYPVPIDNEFKTWKAYGNEYWPHIYLADRQGNLVYDYIGEGAYDRTEQTIKQLLG
ncbi:MAG: alkyl hydroperoxide reductase [Pseudanabaena frigida]|uniref:Alkyl hydroperoxide reductase n=1 Tax=Pseudanabaena frigida TaxID=945775 RepID=A0A2W4W421_9CYAN|nr:MAG: alkyl hydroperoxide reductase [Pseudanabaena frigida]PZO39416.1 MAG: alkyl hydroperoxide reductase [Pseudanabaena frigida]